jgi:cyclic beta-1,2-glucan synthetase
VAVEDIRKESMKLSQYNSEATEASIRRYYSPAYAVPRTHLLGNGHYSVMITAAGSGYSRYREIALTRWREDVTRDHWGSYIFLRDVDTGHMWSAGFQPTCTEAESYEVVFMEDRAKFTRTDKGIVSHLEVFVSPEDNTEVRRLGLTNTGTRTKYLEVTSYAEIILTTQAADIAHPTFSNLFIQTEFVEEISTLLASRRPRIENATPIWLAHVITTDANTSKTIEYETDRLKFIGRNRSIQNPIAIENGRPLSNTVGPVLDPIVSLRAKVKIAPGTTAYITYSTIIGNSREEVLSLADKYHDSSTFQRTSTLAWTEAQIRLHYLNISYGEASLFQQLANRVLYLDSSLRPSSNILQRNSLDVSRLWSHGISGDFPIVLLRIDDVEDRSIVRQLLRAHEYWCTKQLLVDLVILNEGQSSYSQDLNTMLQAMVNGCSYSPGCFIPATKGKIFILRADIITLEEKQLLQTAARATLIAKNGNLAEQVIRLIRRSEKSYKGAGIVRTLPHYSKPVHKIPELDFFNGFGGFTKSSREYLIHLKNGQSTPAPWINVVANENFGFHVSESGASSTWATNSRENQITPWSNDPVSDPSGECFYIFDKDTGHMWCPTTSPHRIANEEYIIKHGQGYSQFEFIHHDIHSTLTQFVHASLPVKISKFEFTNHSNIVRELTLTGYIEWVLGFSRSTTNPYIVTEHDDKTDAIFSYNPWGQEFGKKISFATFIDGNDAWTADRTEFLGRNGSTSWPQALREEAVLSKKVGAGMDSCAVLQKDIIIEAHQKITVIFILGQTISREAAQEIILQVNLSTVDKNFSEVNQKWDNILEKIQVETPDLAMNIMLNRWLLYQNIVCRLWARSAFYQTGGAYGFRDQLQDSMALIWSKPEVTREQIIRAAQRQFIEGDVQHWWHTPSGRGVRTHFSDDLLWLPYVVSYYLKNIPDEGLLNEKVPFLIAELLPLDKEDSYNTPEISTEVATIYEHCARALDCSLKVGVHGLPLMGGGDWNDGMNRVGYKGKGESIWLAWFLILNLVEFAKISNQRGDIVRFNKWSLHALQLKKAIETSGWDGSWYRRAFFDDGTALGASSNLECQIDSLAQTWGVISGAGEHSRLICAMESVEKFLIKSSDQIILLFTPPFDKTTLDPGYIKGYIPGVRENGGQYTHAAIWCIYAYTGLKQGQRAVELFSLINPINHGKNLSEVERYRVEPYVIAADVYSIGPHLGRGGWTWYTGSAAWMYRAGIEAILGFKLIGNRLQIDPAIHSEWKYYKIVYRYGNSTYEIEVNNPHGLTTGVSQYGLDGESMEGEQLGILLTDDYRTHTIVVELTMPGT